MKYPFMLCLLLGGTINSYAQTDSLRQSNQVLDSLYLSEIESSKEPIKVLHAEPLYIDLIRDLGARKGEQEWNVAFGLTDNLVYDTYQALIEYEFAPIDRVGFEVELPFTIVMPQRGQDANVSPGSRMESVKLAAQWSFFVSDAWKTSMAVGYIHEFELSDFRNFGNPLFNGNVFNPFLIVAKRFGNSFHGLTYTGPRIHRASGGQLTTALEINTSVHYMIPGTRNFVGIETNKALAEKDFDMVIRPQMRVGISDNLLVGIVSGIPIERETQRFSMFLRLIWEPGHRHH